MGLWLGTLSVLCHSNSCERGKGLGILGLRLNPIWIYSTQVPKCVRRGGRALYRLSSTNPTPRICQSQSRLKIQLVHPFFSPSGVFLYNIHLHAKFLQESHQEKATTDVYVRTNLAYQVQPNIQVRQWN